MALYDAPPPHSVTTYTVSVSRDAGGGTSLSYSSAQAAVPCSINTASASEREIFAQQGIVVTHTVGFLASVLTTALTRGMKLVTSDTSESYHVRGISKGRAYGNIPAFVYAYCEQQL
jgi:hypothetical protein